MAGNVDPPRVITDARSGSSVEMDGRVRRYAITMAFRTACFVGLFFVHGWLRWALFGAAVFLPYVAVLFANQANQKDLPRDAVTPGAPVDAPRLTARPEPEVLAGEVVADDEGGLHEGPRYRRPDERSDRVA